MTGPLANRAATATPGWRWADVFWDAAASLTFERSRAARPSLALRPWLQGLLQRAKRLRRLGWREHGRLQAAERACAVVGLQFPDEAVPLRWSGRSPWHLPDRFIRLPPAELPRHPVIEPSLLYPWASAVGRRGTANDAVSVLHTLALSDADDVARWQGLPVFSNQSAELPQPHARIAVCLHLFYPDLWPEILASLRFIREPWDLYVSVPSFSLTDSWQQMLRDCPRMQLLPLPNRGRDVSPWLHWLNAGVFEGYDAICKIHSKRSPHASSGDAWRRQLFGDLLGSSANVDAVLHTLRERPGPVLLGSADSVRKLKADGGWLHNSHLINALTQRLGIGPLPPEQEFFAGTMFWFTPGAFAKLRAAMPSADEFPIEMGQTEGTLAHALERLSAALCEDAGGRIVKWSALQMRPAPHAFQRPPSA